MNKNKMPDEIWYKKNDSYIPDEVYESPTFGIGIPYIRKDLSIPKKELEELIERYSQTIDGATVIPHENFFFIISELRKLLEER